MVAGTMDVAGHVAGLAGKMKARMQVSNGGNTLTVKFENIKFAEYVGPFDSPNSWPFDGLNVSCTSRFEWNVLTCTRTDLETNILIRNGCKQILSRVDINLAIHVIHYLPVDTGQKDP